MAGLFLCLDGIDGSGKSTQIQLLRQWLESRGYDVQCVRDPGGTQLGDTLRELLLHRHDISLDMRAEMLLYMASRAQLVAEVIRPALEREAVVVADRYLTANVVYQGHAGGLDPELIWQVGDIAVGGLQPDLSFIFDAPLDVSLARIARQLDRLESRGSEYLARVRAGFLLVAERLADRAVVVDASSSVEQIHERIQNELIARGW